MPITGFYDVHYSDFLKRSSEFICTVTNVVNLYLTSGHFHFIPAESITFLLLYPSHVEPIQFTEIFFKINNCKSVDS